MIFGLFGGNKRRSKDKKGATPGKVRVKRVKPASRKKNVSRTVKTEDKVKVGEVIHYFAKVKAAVIRIQKGRLEIGDKVHIKGYTTDVKQVVKSMQIDHVPVDKASKGKEAAVRLSKKARRGDEVFLLSRGK